MLSYTQARLYDLRNIKNGKYIGSALKELYI